MHLLVTENPPIAVPEVTNLQAYREASWLLKRHAISVLPSVAGLKGSRSTEHRELSPQPFVGFGDPVFRPRSTPPPAGSRGLVATTRSYSDYWSGTEISRDALVDGLSALPATADELKAVAADVGLRRPMSISPKLPVRKQSKRSRFQTSASFTSRRMHSWQAISRDWASQR